MVWRTLGASNFSTCPNGSVQWIWDVFGECAQDGWDEASVGLGLVSILCFAASTFPQYIKACKTGNMDQALSLWFLLGWIGGDSCNLIGSFLADQLPLLYLLSRLPQIRTNFIRQSTQGISYSLFALVMLGNTLYGLSVLLKNPEVGQSEGSYLLHHLPWLVGSLGVLLLDTIISIQFLVYRSHETAAASEREPLLPS